MTLNRRQTLLPTPVPSRSQAFPERGGEGGVAVPPEDPPPQGGVCTGTAAHPARSLDRSGVPIPGTALDLYACPDCRWLDYRPLADGGRRCLRCGRRYVDVTDVRMTDERPQLATAVLPCPSCQGLPYSAGPAGLPQRRCHGCGTLWTPGEGTS